MASKVPIRFRRALPSRPLSNGPACPSWAERSRRAYVASPLIVSVTVPMLAASCGGMIASAVGFVIVTL